MMSIRGPTTHIVIVTKCSWSLRRHVSKMSKVLSFWKTLGKFHLIFNKSVKSKKLKRN